MFHLTENWDEWQGDYYEQDELQAEETNGKLRCAACLCGVALPEKILLFSVIHSFVHSFLFQSLTVKIQVLM